MIGGHRFPSWLTSRATVLILWLWAVALPAADDNSCFVCGRKFGLNETLYTCTDTVAGKKVYLCGQCLKTPDCHLCGVPVGTNAILLPDGRHLCRRDAKTVVLDTRQITKIYERIKDETEREFIRFTTFPTNIQTTIIDRLDVQSLCAPDGHDVECPDILGWCQPVTNGNDRAYQIGLMSGLPLAELQSTCVHEITHAWAAQTLAPARRQALRRSTEEGFCELMAYLMMKKHGEQQQQNIILKNLYTRGQVHLFIEAERQYGLNDILDWMQFGESTNLTTGHLDEIHKLEPATSPQLTTSNVVQKLAVATNRPASPAKTPPDHPARPTAAIKLNGILWVKTPVAIINGKTFHAGESGQIQAGRDLISLHCQAITQDSVTITLTASGKELLLRLTGH
jgi:hypothetical protein